jgi:ribonuclease D
VVTDMKREILRTKEEVINWFNSNKHSVLAFDTETNDSLNYYDLKILAFSAYNGENCMVIDLINNPELDEIMNITKLVLIDTKLVIAHNLAFDLKVLRKRSEEHTSELQSR